MSTRVYFLFYKPNKVMVKHMYTLLPSINNNVYLDDKKPYNEKAFLNKNYFELY